MTEDVKQDKISELLTELRKNLLEILDPPKPHQTGFKITLLDGFIGFEGFTYLDSMVVSEIKKFVEDL